MRLFYTGASSFDVEQKDPNKSLGGWISSTPIPNGMKSNLFGSISSYTSDQLFREVIAIALKNVTTETVNDIEIYFTPDPNDPISKYKIAAVQVTECSTCENQYYMENIDSNKQLPYYATFYEATGEDNAVNVGNLEAGKYIGLWIMREIDLEATSQQKSCDTLNDAYVNGEVLSKIETTKLNLSWT